MKEWPQNWRAEVGMERICEHGVGHPDPDSVAYTRRTKGDDAAGAQSVHGCDGCCQNDKEPAEAGSPSQPNPFD